MIQLPNQNYSIYLFLVDAEYNIVIRELLMSHSDIFLFVQLMELICYIGSLQFLLFQ